MNDEMTRTPQTDEDWKEEFKMLMQADTTIDALRKLREMLAQKPIVWLDAENNLMLASGVTVGAWLQIITAIQNKK